VNRLSGSRYWLATQCRYPFRPNVAWEERVWPAGLLGTAVHSLVEAHQLTRIHDELHVPPQSPHDLEAYPIARQANAWLDNADIPHAVEVAIVYDAATDTARQLPKGKHRDYGELGPMEIPTTLDLVWLTDTHVIIRDLKSGKKQNAHPEQLHIQALAAARLYGRERALVGFLWARKTKADADALEELGPGELEAESWRAASIMRRLPMAQPEPGDWCWACPAKPTCPAHQALDATDMAEAFASVEQETA
jgi:hypothetical protein